MLTGRLCGGTWATSTPSSRILPAGGLLEAGDHAQGRGLAAAGRARAGRRTPRRRSRGRCRARRRTRRSTSPGRPAGPRRRPSTASRGAVLGSAWSVVCPLRGCARQSRLLRSGLTERSVYATFQPFGKEPDTLQSELTFSQHSERRPGSTRTGRPAAQARGDAVPRARRPEGPRPYRRPLSRRAFLGRSAAAAAAFPTLAAFLEACSKSTGSSSGGARRRRRSRSPARSTRSRGRSPTTTSRSPTALTPEQDATVNIYTYTDYLDPQALKDFEKKYKQYNVKCRDHDLRGHDRGARQDPFRRRPGRHLQPELRPDGQAGHRAS